MTYYFPILATILMNTASGAQILRMYVEKSSSGQSALAYLMILGALTLWERFYSIRTPQEKTAVWTARFSIVWNLAVLATVLHYR